MAVPGYDVGLLETEEAAGATLSPATTSELESLRSGTRIAFFGFPMEGMAGGGVDPQQPVATMQSGIVTSMTDFWLAEAEFPKRLLLQHNLAGAGGASGSPIVNANGRVVGILSAGNMAGGVSGAGRVVRTPSGAMVNFGQRIDLLRDIWPQYP